MFGRRPGDASRSPCYAVADLTAEVFAAAFFAAQRAFVASDKRLRPAAVSPPLGLFAAAGFAAVLADAVATGGIAAEVAAFFAAALTARFFFAQRFCCAAAMRWRASTLMTRFLATGAVFVAFKAGAGLAVGWETAVPLSASSAVIAAAMRSRWVRRSVRIFAVSI